MDSNELLENQVSKLFEEEEIGNDSILVFFRFCLSILCLI